jgi:hypothetical protein
MSSQAVTRPSFSVARKWNITLSVLLSLAAMAAIVVMANYLALRYYKRIHWTANEMYKLSPLTEQILHSLTNEVKVTLFFDRTEPLYRAVAALIKRPCDLVIQLALCITVCGKILLPTRKEEYLRNVPVSSIVSRYSTTIKSRRR